ncbi:hypothetical protein B5F39_07325 [Cloacibacillus sp. An23]|nr:hypothetical protein B5F39_07325 [Cloacibacillus sp. An23]
MSNSMVYLIITIGFMLGLACIGIMISRGIKTSEDWMVAGKSLGIIPLTGTYFATLISAAGMVSHPGYYYLNGWPGWWNCAGTILTSFIACIWIARRLRRTGYNTYSEYIAGRFSEKLAIWASFLVVICSIVMLCAQVMGGVAILQTFVDWNKATCCIVLLLVFIAFTAIGGMKAVAWTDTICAFIIICGVWIMAVFFLGEVGGFTAMNEKIAAINPDFIKPFSVKIPPITALSWVVTWGFCNFGAPVFVVRFLTATTPEVAERTQGINAICLFFFYLPLIIIGLCGMIILPGIEAQDRVFLSLVTQKLHPIAGGIMFAAVVAAIISTADSILLLAAATFSNDVYAKFRKVSDQEQLKVSRIATVVIGVASVALSFFMEDAILFIQAKSVTLMGSAMAMLTIVGVMWKRANKAGAVACMVCGLAAACIWYALGEPYGVMAALPGIIVSLIALIVVSCITPPPSDKVIAKFFPESK